MLYHFSENPNINIFYPRKHPSYPDCEPMVWAIDEDRAPIYFLPRDCPRICYWPTTTTSIEDLETFQSETTASKIIVVEAIWYKRILETQLYEYSLPATTFKMMDEGAGYFISRETVKPVKVKPMGDLVQKLFDANVELRFTSSLKPLSDKLLQSTFHFSMIRLRNAIL